MRTPLHRIDPKERIIRIRRAIAMRRAGYQIAYIEKRLNHQWRTLVKFANEEGLELV
jgi:hypothetical protein